MIDKDSLPLDKPRRTPGHPTKSHVVKTRVDGKEKIIRFGEQGASTAGKPKEGESEAMKQKRASFKARHAKNIAKGKSSPAYWANKTKWATGGSVELEDLDEQYAGIKKPDFKMLESFKDLIRTLQARAEDSGTQEFDPVRALGRSGAAGSLEDLYEAYSDKPAPHAPRAEAGAKDPKRTETAKMVFDSFKNAGFSDAQAKALTAEINREGSFNPAYLYGSHTDAANKATNVGMLSWQGDRANRLMSFMADRGLIDPAGRIAPGQDALNAQAEYLRWEMENDPSYTRTRETFLANPDIDQETAHNILGKNFIRWRIDDPKYRGSGFERISEGYDLLNMAQGFAEGGLAQLAHKYDKGGKKKDDDELARSSMLADLELMAQPKNPKAVPAEDPRLLNVGGIGDRLALLNQTFNPVEAIGGAMRAGRDLMDPEAGGYDRLAALGNMLSGVAGVAGPAAVAKRIGAPAATAVMEGLLGASPTAEAVADMARKYAVDEYGGVTIPRAPFDSGRGMGDNGGPAMGTNAISSVNLPPGSDPRYVGAAPDRSGGSFSRYTPKKVPERMRRLIAATDDPANPINAMFDNYIERGMRLKGSDWYNTEEMRDWFTGTLGENEGDKRWREFVDLIGATSTGSAVPDNLRNASFYNALSPADRLRVAEVVKGGGITPAAAARKLGIDVPNMPPEKGPGSYNYGHVMQGNHAANVLNQLEGQWVRITPEGLKGAELTKWLQANPKVKGFANSLLGDTKNIAADKHFMRMLAMADGSPDFLSEQAGGSVEMLDTLRKAYGEAIEPYILTRDVKGKPTVQVNLAKAAKDGVITDASPLQSMPTAWSDTPSATEYAALEEMAQRLATKYDMTPAQFQANLWMGAGDITGLADESQGTAMELFRRTLDKRAKERGLTREEMLREFIMNRAPLAVPIGVGAMSMQSAPAEAGSIEELDQKYAEGGNVEADDEDAYMARQMAAQMDALYAEDLAARGGVPRARTELQDPSLMNVGGVGDRLALINKYLNPVEAIGESMDAGSRMMSADVSGYDRLAALGDMLSGVAGVAGPMAVAKRVGAPAASAVMEGLLGGSPTSEALADMGRKYAVDESGAIPLTFGRIADQKVGDSTLSYKIGDDGVAEVFSVRTPQSKRGQGSARGAMEELLASLDEQGIKETRLIASPLDKKTSTDRLINFYQGLGFKPTGERANALGDPWMSRASPSSAERFGENWDDVYHWSRSPENFSEFDPNKSTSAMSQLGPHVGTQGAAEARYMGFAKPEGTPPAMGFTMPMKADLGKPFLNPATGKPWTEMDLEMFISAVSDVNNIDRKLVAPFMRERLAKEGYTSIPYMNDVEDAGSVSHIMLTERPAGSDAVLRSRFAKFDPAMRNAKNLSAGVAAGAIGASQYDPDAIETTATRVRENKFAAGGAVKYDPAAVDGIINKLREVNRG